MEDITLINRGSSVLNFNKNDNLHTEPLSKYPYRWEEKKQRINKKTQNPKPKLSKIDSPKTKQQIFTLDPDCDYIFHLQEQVGKKAQKPNQNKQKQPQTNK